MRTKSNELISVIWSFEAVQRKIRIHKIHWQHREYHPGKIDFHHTAQQGRVLIHYFSVADEAAGLYFKLGFNSKALTWFLDEVADETGTQ